MLPSQRIEVAPTGFVERTTSIRDVEDRGLVSEIVPKEGVAEALDGPEEWFHGFIIFWMRKVSNAETCQNSV